MKTMSFGVEMRVRKLVSEPKELKEATEWKSEDIPPRYAPHFPKTRPIRNGWKWRSAKVEAKHTNREYILLCQCHLQKDDWKSVLVTKADEGWSVVCRYEFHRTHLGLHIHSHCEHSGILIGPDSLSEVMRIPKNNSTHRRNIVWVKNTFWNSSLKFFRINGAIQEEFEL